MFENLRLKLKQLRAAEIIFLSARPWHAPAIEAAKDQAFFETERRFGFNGHNDRSDAFRHCYWSALLARQIGYIDAWLFTNAHENYDENPPEEKRMDLYNNGIGLKIGRSHHLGTVSIGTLWMKNETELSNKCYDALEKGLLIEGLKLEPKVKESY